MSIVNEGIEAYLEGLSPLECPVLKRLDREGVAEGIPNVKHSTAMVIRSLLALAKPKKILEIGTAIAYSTIHMAQAAPDAVIFTMEKQQDRAERAKRNIEEAGLSDRVHVWTGDAMEMIPTIKSSYDVIFIDAAKGKYTFFLDQAVSLCRPGGMILTDNVLFRGFVTGEHKPEKVATQNLVQKMKLFNQYLIAHPELITSIIPVGDGLAISVKKG